MIHKHFEADPTRLRLFLSLFANRSANERRIWIKAVFQTNSGEFLNFTEFF